MEELWYDNLKGFTVYQIRLFFCASIYILNRTPIQIWLLLYWRLSVDSTTGSFFFTRWSTSTAGVRIMMDVCTMILWLPQNKHWRTSRVWMDAYGNARCRWWWHLLLYIAYLHKDVNSVMSWFKAPIRYRN